MGVRDELDDLGEGDYREPLFASGSLSRDDPPRGGYGKMQIET